MKNIILFVLCSMISTSLYSQTNEPTLSVEQAFEKSYTSEYSKNFKQSISFLESVYSESSYNINLRLGWLYYLTGDYTRSQSYYKKCTALEPRSIEAILGYIYPVSALQNWDDVMKAYKQILSIDPNHIVANYQLAYIFFVRKKYTDAEACLKKALSLYPFDFSSNALLGYVYVKLGKIKEAKKAYHNALENSPQSKEILDALKNL